MHASRLSVSLCAVLGLAGFAGSAGIKALAQVAPPQQPAPPAVAPAPAPHGPHGPVLTDEQGQPVHGVRLAKADLRAIVHGPLAQVTATLTFANTENRVLGGELVFPLPEGATVTGYGLEVNGVMVDGVAVEKQQARVIYEKEMHKGVDPGLVEQAAGNAFRTRLYPVPPNGSRSIKVQYVTELATDQGSAKLSLPMNWGGGAAYTVTIEAPEAEQEPTVQSKATGPAPLLQFHKAEHGYAAWAEAREPEAPPVVPPVAPPAALAAPADLVVSLPGAARPSTSVEKRARATAIEDLEGQAKAGAKNFESFEHYFLLGDPPPAPPAEAARAAAAGRDVKRVAVLWDAGLSRAGADKARELKLLDALLKQWTDARADLVVFRDVAEAPAGFDLSSADGRGQMIEQLSHVVYDGASDLAHLPLPKNLSGFAGARIARPAADYDLVLLFTDGLAGAGTETMQKSTVPVYAVSNAAAVNHALLRQVCRESGGAYFNLQRLPEGRDEQVLSAVGKEPYALVSVTYKPEQVSEVYPASPLPVRAGERITLSGRLLSPEATVTLNYGYGKTITHSETLTLKAADATVGDLVPRYWAQQKVAELSLRPGENEEELSKVGRQFNLVTPNTSLLVLETVEQYVQYRVVPPKSQPEVYKQFLAQIEQHKAQEQQTKEQKLQQVLAWWDARVKWWEQEYKYPKDFKYQGNDESKPGVVATGGGGGGGGGGRGLFGGQSGEAGQQHNATVALSPAPAPPAAPAPVPSPAPVTVAPTTPAPGQGQPPSGGVNAAAGQQPAQAEQLARGMQSEASPNREPALRRSPRGEGEASGRDSAPTARERGRDTNGREDHTRVYDTRDLVINVPDFTDAPKFDLTAPGDPGGTPHSGTSIAIKPWDPAAPYLAAMKAAGAERAYQVFLEQRKSYGSSPAFYLEAGDLLERMGRHEQAVRVLSDVAALRLADARLLRVAARRLLQAGERQRAIEMLEAVLRMRPEEPQSHRDLALALSDRADALADLPKGDLKRDSGRIGSDYARCLSLLNEVITGRWERFQEIELPCLMEANRVLARVRRMQQAGELGDVPVPLDPRLVKDLECDVRVAMEWDADSTDIDLWVTEPSGEKCFYGHNRTTIGGLLSRDFTDGYGPEEYCLRRLMPGRYLIQANFYGSRQQELTGPATVTATVFTDFGRPSEKKQTLTLRLDQAKQVVDIGSVTLGHEGKGPQVDKAQDVRGQEGR